MQKILFSLCVLSLLAHASGQQESSSPPDELQSEQEVVFTLGPDGDGSSRSFTYTVGTGNRVFFYAIPDRIEITIELRDAFSGLLAEGKELNEAPELLGRCEVSPGQTISIAVAIRSENATGEVRLHLFETAETDETRDAAKEARKAIRKIKSLQRSGDVEGARRLLNDTLDALEEAQGSTPSEQISERCWTIGRSAMELGDTRAAVRAWTVTMNFDSLALPGDHLQIQSDRLNLGTALAQAGDGVAGMKLQRAALEARQRVLPPDHPEIQWARGNLAITLKGLGEIEEARRLEEEALAAWVRTVPDDDVELQGARLNLATTLGELGDLRTARILEEKVLSVYERILPPDHYNLQIARMNLASIMFQLGDPMTASVLEAQVLEVWEKVLPEDHPHLQDVRANLAGVLAEMGDLEGALEIQTRVLEIRERTLPPDHPELQVARLNLSLTIAKLGDLESARELQETALVAMEKQLPEDHLDLQRVRIQLAETIKELGDRGDARKIEEEVLAALQRSLPPDHPLLRSVRMNLLWTLASLGQADPCPGLLEELCEDIRNNTLSFGEVLAPRELEVLTLDSYTALSTILSFLAGVGTLPPLTALEEEAFAAVEVTRSVAASRSRLASDLRALAKDDRIVALQETIAATRAEVSRFSHSDSMGEEYFAAVRRKENAQRQLQEHLSSHPLMRGLLPDSRASAIAETLDENEAALGFWRYDKLMIDPETRGNGYQAPHYLVYVVRHGHPLERVDLGAADTIERAIDAWRGRDGTTRPRGVAASSPDDFDSILRNGQVLRKLVFDPLRPFLAGIDKLVVALDDATFSFPLDALPDGEGYLGDRYQVTFRSSLKELTVRRPPLTGSPSLLAMGGIDYDLTEQGAASGETEGATATSTEAASGGATGRGLPENLLRSGDERRTFTPLPGTEQEVDRLARSFQAAFPAGSLDVFSGDTASRDAFEKNAPGARFLHLATHAYFAGESVASTRDARVGEESSAQAFSHDHQVVGYSPMVLCGIALAGANQPPDDYGHIGGVMTAEELSSLDLSDCELAVLSACETKAGVRRAGQGIASLQQALEAAGVRSTITALWLVPDQATQELMTEFYRRWWVLGEPRPRALWEAKRKLREKRDPDGRPTYSPRDWAGWVLTGDPED